MGPKTFKEIVDRIFPIRSKLVDFDYPDYGGLPTRIAYRMSPEAVDAMQDTLSQNFTTKREFAKNYKNKLIELGEKYGN